MPGCDDYDDAGCCIKGDIADCSCRLIPPVRFLLGWGRRKKAMYYREHEWDGIDEWYKKEEEQRKKFETIFKEEITDKYALCFKGKNGVILMFEGEPIVDNSPELYRFRNKAQELFSPPKYIPLHDRWRKLIKDTWHKFVMIFKPYFCK